MRNPYHGRTAAEAFCFAAAVWTLFCSVLSHSFGAVKAQRSSRPLLESGFFLVVGMFLAAHAALCSTPVELQMRDVNLYLDRFTVLKVATLRGRMVPTNPNEPVTLDDANSFVMRIGRAQIAISLDSLSKLINERVFGYPNTPLKHIVLRASGDRIQQTGTMHKGIEVPFEIEGPIEPTPEGDLRLHADKIYSAHIPVKGLLHLFGKDLSKLVNLRQDRGISIEHDDILIHPGRILPPPLMEGKISRARIQDDCLVLTFDSGSAAELSPPYKSSSYIYHRGGVLRFGKLTMSDSDLEIVSESRQRPFDFSLPNYDRQLTAGYSKNTPSGGLIVFMPDLLSLRSGAPAAVPANRTPR